MRRNRGRTAGQCRSGCVLPRQGIVLTDGRLKVAGEKVKRTVWDARIDDLFGRPTRMPLEVEDLLVNGVLGPRKCLVQPESMMTRVLGTKVRCAVVFATFYL